MAFPQKFDDGKFVTCGKDRKLILHFMEYGDDTMENTVPISMACGPYNEILTSCKKSTKLYNLYSLLVPRDYIQENTLAEFDYSKPVKPLIVQYSHNTIPSFNDSDNLIKLAKM